MSINTNYKSLQSNCEIVKALKTLVESINSYIETLIFDSNLEILGTLIRATATNFSHSSSLLPGLNINVSSENIFGNF